jgi:hypothetical protein
VSGAGPESAEDDAAAARRSRLRQQVFGDVLPDTTADEREQGAGEPGDRGDEWLRSNVPPHHG